MENRNKASLPSADQTTANAALVNLERIFEPIAPSLTPEQRQTMPRINVANKAFVEDASNVLGMPAAATVIPPYIKKADLDIDLLTFEQLDAFIGRTRRVLTIMEDIRTVAGSKGYVTALLVKKMFDAAALSGITGAAEISRKLGERFEGQGGLGNGADNAANP